MFYGSTGQNRCAHRFGKAWLRAFCTKVFSTKPKKFAKKILKETSGYAETLVSFFIPQKTNKLLDRLNFNFL